MIPASPSYPGYANAFFKKNKSPSAYRIVHKFHRWLAAQDLRLNKATSKDLYNFLQKPQDKIRKLSSIKNDAYVLQRYIDYLYLRKLLKVNLQIKLPTKKNLSLPPCANKFLKTSRHRKTRPIIKYFHSWLKLESLTLSQLTPNHIQTLILELPKKQLSQASIIIYTKWLDWYLSYLHQNKLLEFSPESFSAHSKPLPPLVKEFVAEISARLPKASKRYTSSLRAFYYFLDRSSIEVADFERPHLIAWMLFLSNRKLHPATRSGHLIQIRVYLRWLYEHHYLKVHPDDIVRSSDFPKLPEYLPRPLDPQVDQALQVFWLNTKHNKTCAKGLWIMRKTGLRVGELLSLEFDCIRLDQLNNAFLKVPLGKLNTERLVPITPQTVQVISQIQQFNPMLRAYLIATNKTQKLDIHDLYAFIKISSKKINIPPFQSHQLRHSAATELINSGMSLISVMKFLGHKDFRMTLRYAKITQHTVLKEFQSATLKAEQKYNLAPTQPADIESASTAVTNLIKRYHQKNISIGVNNSVLKRLYRLRRELQKIENAIIRTT